MFRLAPLPVLLLALLLLLAGAGVATPARAMDAQQVFARAENSVVVVTSLNALKQPIKFGTGFVVGDGTQVVTNHHVVDGAAIVTIKTPDDQVSQVTVLATDSTQDLALLKLDGWGPALDVADSLPEVGQDVAVIGTPKGLERTLSTGVVSALREMDGRQMVQITAPVSEGSSGGPVLDSQGRVVGVATLVVDKGQNLNFAISNTEVLRFLGQPVSRRKPTEEASAPAQPQPSLEIKKGEDGSIEIIQPRRRKQ